MIQVGRRIYYDEVTGEIISEKLEQTHYFERMDTSIDYDISVSKELSERNRETFDVLELPFGAYQQDFAESNGYRVNVVTKELEFSYPDPNDPEAPPVFQKPLTDQIMELKANQFEMNQVVEGQGASQQELLELLIDMGVI